MEHAPTRRRRAENEDNGVPSTGAVDRGEKSRSTRQAKTHAAKGTGHKHQCTGPKLTHGSKANCSVNPPNEQLALHASASSRLRAQEQRDAHTQANHMTEQETHP